MTVHALQPQPDTEGSDLDQLTLLYKALADQLRLQILRLLRNESFGVLELCRILEIKQSALSHHLKILATADVVTTRREGNLDLPTQFPSGRGSLPRHQGHTVRAD